MHLDDESSVLKVAFNVIFLCTKSGVHHAVPHLASGGIFSYAEAYSVLDNNVQKVSI